MDKNEVYCILSGIILCNKYYFNDGDKDLNVRVQYLNVIHMDNHINVFNFSLRSEYDGIVFENGFWDE